MHNLQDVEVSVTLNSLDGIPHYLVVVVVPYNAGYTRASLASIVVAKEAEWQIIQGILAEKQKTQTLLQTLDSLREKVDLK